jgi:hypothetical protein
MTISILFGSRKAGRIGELQMDAVIREIPNYRNNVTQFPVEDGSSINDNIRIMPDEINIVGFVTNSPIDVIQASNAEVIENVDGSIEIKNLRRTDVLNSVELAQDILLRISGRKIEGKNQVPKLVDVVTGLRVYHRMAITALRMPRDSSIGQALRFEITLVNVENVFSESVVIKNPSTSGTVSDQAQSTIEKGKTTPSQSKVSTLRKGGNKLVEFAKAKK